MKGFDTGTVVTGLDLGLAHCGWSDLMLLRDGEEVQDLGVWVTEKSNKKQNVLSSDDDLRRARELAVLMADHVDKVNPFALVVEAKSLPRNASAACKIGMAWGVFATVAMSFHLPVVQASPQQVRKALGLAKNASKQDVKAMILGQRDLIPERVREKFCATIPDTRREHPIDATAAVLACRESEILRLARGSASRR